MMQDPWERLSPLERDTLRVIDLTGRMEAALAAAGRTEDNLKGQIEGLRREGLAGNLVKAMHYCRMARNRVVHHPRSELKDRMRFEGFATLILQHLEPETPPSGSPSDVLRHDLPLDAGSLAFLDASFNDTEQRVSASLFSLEASVDASLADLAARLDARGSF